VRVPLTSWTCAPHGGNRPQRDILPEYERTMADAKSPHQSEDFQSAVSAARQTHGEATWATMTVREQAAAIYIELQKIDAYRVRVLIGTRRK
jgi:hypothetical protein